MTMYALQRRAKDCGITVSSLHPGTVSYVLTYVTAYGMYAGTCMLCINDCMNVQIRIL